MDIERGNIEIVFQKIPYMYAIKSQNELVDYCSYSKIAQDIYMRYSAEVFSCATDDERRNNYLFMCNQMKIQTDWWKNDLNENIGVFQLVFSLADKILRLDGNEIRCKFDQLLRWREISLLMGQDFFTCAYLAFDDWKKGYNTQYFAWLPIIRSDDSRLHNILEQGVAENHFHLNGSTKIFELNWLCLMNHISGRNAEFRKITRTMQMQRNDSFDKRGVKEDFYTECLRAALYRVYLFLLMKENKYMFEMAEVLVGKVEKGISLREVTSDIQNLIAIAGNLYGAKIDGKVLDYALENKMMKYNDNVCRLLAGERKFLYCCYRHVLTGQFNRRQKNIFYVYLIMRTDFRGELIQNNKKIGFANFSDYQDRKEYFIEGHKPYEDELVRLALNESLTKKNMLSLEARICPKNSSAKLIKSLKNYERIIKSEPINNGYDKLIYVLHFPKLFDGPFMDGAPRNNNVRKMAARQARSIVAMLDKNREINQHIKGIDACSSEIACRPEVFGQVYRYLTSKRVNIENDSYFHNCTNVQNLQMTYHVGEDFFDITDGLRAIDEVLLFCNFRRGNRLGHALALGISPEKYYAMKGYKVVLSKQILLDDIAWIYCKSGELGYSLEEKLKAKLIEEYTSLYKEIYENNIRNGPCPSIHEYYQSWKLRGDNPQSYRLEEKEFNEALKKTELVYFDRFRFNPRVDNKLRRNKRYRDLYYYYHFNKKVREKGNEITEFKVTDEYIKLVRGIQDKMIIELARQGIGIETNPSSNYLIGTIRKYEEHPIIRFNSRNLKETNIGENICVSINTDDQGVFDTLLENEYALMTLALKKATDEDMNTLYDIEDIYEWIDYVRKMGINQVFS